MVFGTSFHTPKRCASFSGEFKFVKERLMREIGFPYPTQCRRKFSDATENVHLTPHTVRIQLKFRLLKENNFV